ncbi:MAG: septum formation initiator family protein, partial [Methylococcales bacterium]
EKKLRNEALYAEVLDLRKGQEALEERARDELGMIKENETFFQVIE